MEQSISLEKPVKIDTGDRRLTMRLMGLWRAVRDDGARCPRADLFVVSLSQELLDDCCFVERDEHGGWEIRRIGPTVGHCSGVAGESAKIEDLPDGSLLATAVCELQTAYTSQVAIVDQGEVQGKYRRKTLFRSILLPLTDASGHIIKFVAGARCRVCVHDA